MAPHARPGRSPASSSTPINIASYRRPLGPGKPGLQQRFIAWYEAITPLNPMVPGVAPLPPAQTQQPIAGLNLQSPQTSPDSSSPPETPNTISTSIILSAVSSTSRAP